MGAPAIRDPDDLGELSEVGQWLVESYLRHPVRFVIEVLNDRPCVWQRNALAEFLGDDDYGTPGCQKYSIRGCTTSGKNRFSAYVGWHTLATKFYSKTTVTAPNAPTLDDNTFGELSALYRQSPLMRRVFTVGTRRVVANGPAGREWWLKGRVARAAKGARAAGGGPKHSEGIAGRYAKWTTAIADEASHPDMDSRIDAMEGSATSPRRIVLVQGNPLRGSGRFFDIHNKPAFMRYYKLRRVGYLDSPFTGGVDFDEEGKLTEPELADRAALRASRDEWREKYGEASAYYQARALGEFPTEQTVNTIFPARVVTAAMARFEEYLTRRDDVGLPLIIGIDCARWGDDETVWYVRRGLVSIAMEFAGQTDGPDIAGRAIELARRILEGKYEVSWQCPATGVRKTFAPQPHPQASSPNFNIRRWVSFRIDEGGLAGLGPVDYMRRDSWSVAGVQNQGSPSQQFRLQYRDIGCELWNEDGLNFAGVGSLVPDENLANQLKTREYRFTGKGDGQRYLEPKDEYKARGYGSPDRGDSYVLAAADGGKLDFAGADLARKIAFVSR